MSFTVDIKRETITIDGETFDVTERDGSTHYGWETTLTIEQDGEQVYEGIEARIWSDDDQGVNDPRDWSNVGTMFCDYPRYNLGDEDAPDPRDSAVECEACEGTGYADKCGDERDECEVCHGHGEIHRDIVTVLREDHGATVIMPLYVYEHSGITMRCGAPVGPMLTPDDVRSTGRFMGDDAGWDTSTVGFVWDTPKGRRECIGEDATPEQVEAALRSEVEVYASYLEGDVTGYTVEDDESGYHDSCGGFVGGHGDYTREEAYGSLALAIIERRREEIERDNAAARDIITV
jgi:hypothetical protein